MSVARAPLPSEHESVGALVQRLGGDVTRIVRAEIALAQLRVRAAVDTLKTAAGGLVAAVALALVGLGAVVAGVILLVATVLPPWVAALSVGGGLLLVAGIVVAIEVRVLARGVTEALSPIDGPSLEERRHGE